MANIDWKEVGAGLSGCGNISPVHKKVIITHLEWLEGWLDRITSLMTNGECRKAYDMMEEDGHRRPLDVTGWWTDG